MSADPYHTVQQEVQSSLQTGSQLLSSYVRIRSTAKDDSEELTWARNELKATLAALEADLDALDESVKAAELAGPRAFGLDAAEVLERRRYVSHVQKEVENMRAELSVRKRHPLQSHKQQTRQPSRPGSVVGSSSGSGTASPAGRYLDKSSYPMSDLELGAKEDDQAAWAQEEQQLMIREQEQTMESIAGTLSTLAQQAGLMGQELGEHNELLTDLERNVDRTDTKLSDATRRMRKFLRDAEEKGSGYCIIFLIIILAALLLVVILV
ncbi:hypothetical protein APHAL10511_003405 [Amanita phalloides]|nr:hypothetical protein APHAL10511_003405 [Amanita phalloides]